MTIGIRPVRMALPKYDPETPATVPDRRPATGRRGVHATGTRTLPKVLAAFSALLVGLPVLFAPPAPAAEFDAPVEQFSAIVERPLFRADRTAFHKPAETDAPESDAVAEPEQGLALRFVGTVFRNSRAIALVELDGEVELVRLSAGDRLGDWRVVEVGPDSLLLSDGHEERRFVLFER